MNEINEKYINHLQEQVIALTNAIRAALEPLGTGDCAVNQCEGCKFEIKEAIAILNNALIAIPDDLRDIKPQQNHNEVVV